MTDFAELLHEVGSEIRDLTVEKNMAYGDAVNKTAELLEILYPDGIGVELLPDALLLTRCFDKMVRIAQGDKSAFGEDPWRDIGGYALIGVAQGRADA